MTFVAFAAQAQLLVNSPIDTVYAGHRTILSATIAVQVITQRNVTDFAWSPDGTRIAYLSRSNDYKDYAVTVVRPDGSRTHTYFQQHRDDTVDPAVLQDHFDATHTLIGWSQDGNHLVFTADANHGTPDGRTTAAYDINMTSGNVRPITVPATDPNDMQPIEFLSLHWSARHDWLAFETGELGATGPFYVYDADKNLTRPILSHLPMHYDLSGWSCSDNLLVYGYSSPNGEGVAHWLLLNGVSGDVIPVQASETLGVPAKTFQTRRVVTDTGSVILSLRSPPDTTDEYRHANGRGYAESQLVRGLDGKDHGRIACLWVVATQSNAKMPNGRPSAMALPSNDSKQDKVDPRLLIDTFRLLPQESADRIQVQLAPPRPGEIDHAWLAYLKSGNLYLADLQTRPTTLEETIAEGEPLTSNEKLAEVTNDAWRIAFVLRQYLKGRTDAPSSEAALEAALAPMGVPATAFTVDGHGFHYLLTGDDSLDPDTNPLAPVGYFDLLGQRVTIYLGGFTMTAPIPK